MSNDQQPANSNTENEPPTVTQDQTSGTKIYTNGQWLEDNTAPVVSSNASEAEKPTGSSEWPFRIFICQVGLWLAFEWWFNSFFQTQRCQSSFGCGWFTGPGMIVLYIGFYGIFVGVALLIKFIVSRSLRGTSNTLKLRVLTTLNVLIAIVFIGFSFVQVRTELRLKKLDAIQATIPNDEAQTPKKETKPTVNKNAPLAKSLSEYSNLCDQHSKKQTLVKSESNALNRAIVFERSGTGYKRSPGQFTDPVFNANETDPTDINYVACAEVTEVKTIGSCTIKGSKITLLANTYNVVFYDATLGTGEKIDTATVQGGIPSCPTSLAESINGTYSSSIYFSNLETYFAQMKK